MANSWEQLRQAGAEARARLIAAAAKTGNVDPATITIEKGIVKDAAGHSARFLGELVGLAQQRSSSPARSSRRSPTRGG